MQIQLQKHNTMRKQARVSGFTLVEALVAIGISVVVMTMTATVFSGGIASFKRSTQTEKATENAQFIMNDMMKQLRTSTVVNPIGNPAANTNPVSIRFFDHSQSQCFIYRQHIAPNYIERTVAVAGTTFTDCENNVGFNGQPTNRVTIGDVSMALRIVSSDRTTTPKRAGLVTVVFTVAGGSGSPTVIQSSVALRDYNNIGLY